MTSPGTIADVGNEVYAREGVRFAADGEFVVATARVRGKPGRIAVVQVWPQRRRFWQRRRSLGEMVDRRVKRLLRLARR